MVADHDGTGAVQPGQGVNPAKVRTTRYRYRGAAIPAAWSVTG
jgi:hypothetical protein